MGIVQGLNMLLIHTDMIYRCNRSLMCIRAHLPKGMLWSSCSALPPQGNALKPPLELTHHGALDLSPPLFPTGAAAAGTWSSIPKL